MTASHGHRVPFFPKADAAVLTSKRASPLTRPKSVGPVLDPDNIDQPIGRWPSNTETAFYPKTEPYAAAAIPDKPITSPTKYLRAFLAENERLRLSMLWYYTRDISKEEEFLSGLQEKAYLAQESTGWEFAVIGILDVNVYIRLATVGLELGILPRGETICAHTVTQPPGSVFLLPNLMEDWRFQKSPYLERGGLRAYAGAPLRLQNEFGECVGLGSLCVASSTSEEPLTKEQQQALVRLADWVVSDLVQCARARRQRERRQMSELISMAQKETEDVVSEEPVLRILKNTFPDANVSIQSAKATHLEVEGREPVPISDFEADLWEDIDYLNDFIRELNHLELPSSRTVRIITAPCESALGPSLLVVEAKDFHHVFDDVDSWFVQTCAGMFSQLWRKRLLIEAMKAKEKFLRGFSHQLRTPIHGILGSVELLAEELQSRNLGEFVLPMVKGNSMDSRQPSMYLNLIKMAGRDLTAIVNNMITLNRWSDIAVQDRQLAMHTFEELETEIGNEILKLMSGDARYKTSIFFTRDFPPGCESFQTDLNVLRDTLLPLIINAIQHTPLGTVSITAAINLDRKQLTFDIKDTGIGIHPDHQARIFEPYEKIDVHSTGAGLGLTLASKFATLLHGSVDLISSDIDRGSHFRAVFRKVECICLTQPSQSLASSLNDLPSQFFILATGSENKSLCDHFSTFLCRNGFTASNDLANSFIVLDMVPDIEQHRTHLSQILTEQVAICLVPASDTETALENTRNNAIYTSGPFTTTHMRSLLERAQTKLIEIKASRLPPQQSDTHSVTLTRMTEAPNPDETSSSHSLTSQSDTAASVKSARTNPIMPILTPSSNPTVLIVDDNAVNLRIVEMYCRKRGLQSYSASDGLQAVKIFSHQQALAASGAGTAIELVFMDLQMPVCDGIEAMQQIRSLEKHNQWGTTLIFVMTGQDSPSDRIAANGAGADEFFVKPVVIKQLDRVIKRYFPAFEPS
ncbi:histidine kinase HHK3 [Penicillium maclennaniae]|uniref:histidine kinase HHK3 n=1 Tax=Penicillium maclennaniae TaxID=1343394 RepID=UPI00253FB8BC|nr:histidine kinase HHK3 [Penicillium maclennaniae]KAJ5678345.1 histidine kinase HHK3 [Penicillium maclennaniae]